MLRFVPHNIGLNAITREQYIERHAADFANRLCNPNPNNPVAIAYIDGTYVYMHKSSNFRALRQSYSIHKGRHLIKLALQIQNGDTFIVDRGYRDVLPLLENLGIHHKMPALLQPGQRQLNTQAANHSRIITKTRWLVEARNGHIKSVFQFFEGTVSMN